MRNAQNIGHIVLGTVRQLMHLLNMLLLWKKLQTMRFPSHDFEKLFMKNCIKYTRIRVLSGLHIPIFTINMRICGPDKTLILKYFPQ